MHKYIKMFSRQLLGARYERLGRSLISGGILFIALYAAEIRLAIAPSVFYLSTVAFTAGVMWRLLNGSDNTAALQGVFQLPFENKKLVFGYTFALAGYALFSKTFLLWAGFFAVSRWNMWQGVTALLCGWNACLTAVAVYVMGKRKRYFAVMVWLAGILLVLFAGRNTGVVFAGQMVSLCIAVPYLLSADAYLFYRQAGLGRTAGCKSGRGSVMVYLVRYLLINKNYLTNTFALMAVAGFLPFFFRQFEGVDMMPLGFAILCLNTPICILLSCDGDLERAVRMLPGQGYRFCSRYCLFIFTIHMTVNNVYLCSFHLQCRSVGGMDFLTAVVFALQSAVLSVLLEWVRPIRNWKTENDLWHHPRKYIVPGLMMGLAVFVSMQPEFLWVWLGALALECVGLTLAAGKS